MEIKINRRKIESICIFISITLAVTLTALAILCMADEILSWNLLPYKVEKVAYLFIGAAGIIIGAAFIICVMLNISILTLSVEKIADSKSSTPQE